MTAMRARDQHPSSHMRPLAIMAVVICLATMPVSAAPPAPITTQRAVGHAMRYHLALPTGWTRERTWPVVIVIPDASRRFVDNLQKFVVARGDRPFLLVAPE